MPSKLATRPNAAKTMSAFNGPPPATVTSTCEKPSNCAPFTSTPPRYAPPIALNAERNPDRKRSIQKSQRLGGLVDQGHRAAERSENRRILAGDHAAAEYDHGAGNVGQAQNRVAVENVLMVDLDGGDVARTGAGGEENPRRSQCAAAAVQTLNFDPIAAQEHPAAADQLDLVARELRLQITVLSCDDRIDSLQQRGQWRIAGQFDGQEDALPRMRR